VAEVVATATAHDPGADVAAVPPTTVPEFVALVGRAAVAVTNNSAGMHVADAVGTPVAVAHAGTERLTDMRPRAVPAALLHAPVPCSPCRQLDCPFDGECLDVAPERLAAAALALADPDRGPTALREEDPWWNVNALLAEPAARQHSPASVSA
jgi:ADP-heptose:LPS heptosyltransferase